MKYNTITAALVAFTALLPDASAITADDLARYFGISSWSTTVTLPAESFTTEIYTIKDGIPDKKLIEGMPAWNKNPENGLTILVGSESGKYKVVIAYGGGVTMGVTSDIPVFSYTMSQGLPEKIQEGDYALYGKPKKGALPSDSISSYESGFLLRVKK